MVVLLWIDMGLRHTYYSFCPGMSVFFAFMLLTTIVSGMLFGDESLWLSSAATLTVFDISKAVENGIEITPEFDPSSNSIRYAA